jgi:hypothetical protein
MGWIAKRKLQRGVALYNEGPKRKGPLRKIVKITSWENNFFGAPGTGWLECGHWINRIYGEKRAICEKCGKGKPKDKMGKDGWPKISIKREE